MDCDGPKHSIVHDVDGKLVKTSGNRGSIIPEAEIRFDISRLPEPMLYSGSDLTTRLNPDTVVDKRGIARGNDGYALMSCCGNGSGRRVFIGILMLPALVACSWLAGMHTDARVSIITCWSLKAWMLTQKFEGFHQLLYMAAILDLEHTQI